MAKLTGEQIIRAWQDEAYRNSLSAEQLEQLPAAPHSLNELSEDELEVVAGGGADTNSGCKCGCWGGTVTWTDAQ